MCASVGALSSQLLASLDPDASGALNAVSQLATLETCLLASVAKALNEIQSLQWSIEPYRYFQIANRTLAQYRHCALAEVPSHLRYGLEFKI